MLWNNQKPWNNRQHIREIRPPWFQVPWNFNMPAIFGVQLSSQSRVGSNLYPTTHSFNGNLPMSPSSSLGSLNSCWNLVHTQHPSVLEWPPHYDQRSWTGEGKSIMDGAISPPVPWFFTLSLAQSGPRATEIVYRSPLTGQLFGSEFFTNFLGISARNCCSICWG